PDAGRRADMGLVVRLDLHAGSADEPRWSDCPDVGSASPPWRRRPVGAPADAARDPLPGVRLLSRRPAARCGVPGVWEARWLLKLVLWRGWGLRDALAWARVRHR